MINTTSNNIHINNNNNHTNNKHTIVYCAPRIAPQGTVCPILLRSQARTTRIDQFKLDEGFETYHNPFRIKAGAAQRATTTTTTNHHNPTTTNNQ